MEIYERGYRSFPSEEAARKDALEEIEEAWDSCKTYGEKHLEDFTMLTNIEEKIIKNGNRTIHLFAYYYQYRLLDGKLHVWLNTCNYAVENSGDE